MFTKLSDLNKAIIFTVLVLFMGLIAGLIVNLLNVASEFLGAGLYAFTPAVATLVMLPHERRHPRADFGGSFRLLRDRGHDRAAVAETRRDYVCCQDRRPESRHKDDVASIERGEETLTDLVLLLYALSRRCG